MTIADETHQDASPAANQVFTTTELLEAILLEVDMKTLLLAQRVDRIWQATIKSSIKLQEKLWFRTPSSDTTIGETKVNPLLVRNDKVCEKGFVRRMYFHLYDQTLFELLVFTESHFGVLVHDGESPSHNIDHLNPGSWKRASLFRAHRSGRFHGVRQKGDTSLRYMDVARRNELLSNKAVELVENVKDMIAVDAAERMKTAEQGHEN